ncbi:MAG: helix-turn-helix domain-containing protein [Chloroflexi bacterium]|nr:helix-turn-helix domain-containing protein [Chloroflexota bacterium]
METSRPISFVGRGPGYSVSISDILRLALPAGSTVLVGQGSLERRVFWARLLGPRPPALGHTEAGEMVLLPASISGARSFPRVVRELVEAGVGAFLVAGAPHEEGLSAATELGTPILRLVDGGSLVDAERSIISLIVDREGQLRRKVEQIYERLLATLVEDAGIRPLASEVAQVTGRMVVVLDEYFRVQVTEPDDEGTRALGRALGGALAKRDPRTAGRPATAPFRLGRGRGEPDALVVPLRLRGMPAGYLGLAGAADVSDLDREIADRAARVLGIELAKQRAVTEAQLRLQGDFLDDVLSGRYPSEEAMLARAKWVGHNLALPHVVLALAVDEPAGSESRRLQAADLVRTELLRIAPDALLREQQGTLALALPRAAAADREQSVALAEGLREQLASRVAPSAVTIGVGRAHLGVAGIGQAYREAEQALAVARALQGGSRTVHFEELGVQRLLFQLRENPELASFYDDVLGRLQAHDERQGADLVNTLEAFFECHGNHVRTAQRLHLHRNTLLYRLERARQILDINLDDSEVRLALQVALKIGRVIGRRPIPVAAAMSS